MEGKIEKWLEKRGQDLKEEWMDTTKTDIIRKEIESPLEKLFFVEWSYQTFQYEDLKDFFITPQYCIGNYRVDFVIYKATLDEWHNGGAYTYPEKHKDKSLIIELDSYLWHGSDPTQFTKEKERERELKKEGWDMMRFSGREIYNNIERCIEEVIGYFRDKEEKELLG